MIRIKLVLDLLALEYASLVAFTKLSEIYAEEETTGIDEIDVLFRQLREKGILHPELMLLRERLVSVGSK